MCCMLHESMWCIFAAFAVPGAAIQILQHIVLWSKLHAKFAAHWSLMQHVGSAIEMLCVLGCQLLCSAFAAHMIQVQHIYPNTQSAASILVN